MTQDKDARIAELEAENERLRNMVDGYGKLDAEAAVADRNAEAISRTGAVKATGVIDTLIESLSEGLMTDAGLSKADRDAMRHQISALETAKAEISALEPTAPEGQQPVAWQRRQKDSDVPGYIPQWQFVSKEEATGHFEKKPGYEYRPLYTRPSEQAVTEAEHE